MWLAFFRALGMPSTPNICDDMVPEGYLGQRDECACGSPLTLPAATPSFALGTRFGRQRTTAVGGSLPVLWTTMSAAAMRASALMHGLRLSPIFLDLHGRSVQAKVCGSVQWCCCWFRSSLPAFRVSRRGRAMCTSTVRSRFACQGREWLRRERHADMVPRAQVGVNALPAVLPCAAPSCGCGRFKAGVLHRRVRHVYVERSVLGGRGKAKNGDRTI